jgi:hypothetical protein
MMKETLKGVTAVALLVSATSVVNTVTGWMDIPMTNWLDTWITSYQALFHYLIDSTLGRLVRLFGFEISSFGKDCLVFYAAFGAAMIRTGEKEGSVSMADRLTMWGIWPLILLSPVLFETRDTEEQIADNPEKYVTMGGIHAGSTKPMTAMETYKVFATELVKVMAIAGAAMLANSAGVLN